MARKSKFALDPEPAQDLTPMIDIVFNLIIFFMIVSELNNNNLEQVKLPYANNAEDGKSSADEKVLQINVLADGLVKVRGNPYTTDPQLSNRYQMLGDFLEIEAAGFEREAPEPGQQGTPPSAMRVNIRADREARFRFVQGVFDACMKNGIYKTSIAASPDTAGGQ